jgi:orotidine-5'-phosphate decarboxylase
MNGSRVIVALDFAEAAEALAFAARVQPAECRLKVGLELYTRAGPALVSSLVESGFDVFLDLKYHDIPNTVARACAAAANLGVWMLNVHALGGARMLDAARAAIDAAPRRPLLIGVTLLTSHADADVRQIGLVGDIGSQVERLAESVRAAGLDGVVCAATEAPRLRRRFGEEFVLVTPGIRPTPPSPSFPPPEGEGGEPLRAARDFIYLDDQRRTMTPLDAVRAGSDFLVIGRPVTRAGDPLAVLQSIRTELAAHG